MRRYWTEYRGTLLFLMLMLGFRSAWADWVVVPTGSMNPTVLEGDRLLVDKHVFGLRVPFSHIHLTWGEEPRRGDVVVFDSPVDGTSLVKRLMAVPGDTVEMRGEQLIVNGLPARYAPGDRDKIRTLLAGTRAQQPVTLKERAFGTEHDILLLPDRGPPGSLGPVRVPPAMYFMLGDNRDNSADSRYIGFVPRRNLMGRATRVVVSLDPDHHFLPRPGRTLQTLD